MSLPLINGALSTVFIDTEFTNFEKPEALSIGLVTEDGCSCYAELASSSLARASRRASQFVVETVLPQFGLLAPETRVQSPPLMGARVADWLRGLGDGPLQIVYDYHQDAALLESLLTASGDFESLRPSLVWCHVGFLVDQDEFIDACERSWCETESGMGIARHHALADAFALRAGFAACHGGGLIGAGSAGDSMSFDASGDAPSQASPVDDLRLSAADLLAVAARHRAASDLAEDADATPVRFHDAPIVFLDFDDVVCLYQKYGGRDAIHAINTADFASSEVFQELFHPPAVATLRRIHDAMGGKLRYVISSTWRDYFNRSQLREVLRLGGLDFVAACMESQERWRTPSLDGDESNRLEEVSRWLSLHHRGEPFAILDDVFSGLPIVGSPLQSRSILCDERVGLLVDHVEVAVNALRTPAR